MKSIKLATIGTLMLFNTAVPQAIDNSFGTNGIVVSELSQGVDALNAMTLQADGKILASGFAGDKLALLRYETDGSLDSSFGNGGIVTSNFVCGFGSPFEIAVQPNGKILALTRNGNTMLVARYTANGILDASFGSNGIANITSDSGSMPFCTSMEMLPSGGFIVAGSVDIDTVFIIRYGQNGNLDTTFGTGGYTLTEIPMEGSISADDLCIAPDGSIFVTGAISAGYANFALFRYSQDGLLDTGFGTGGIVTTDIGGINVSDYPTKVKIQPNGKILLSGFSNTNFVAASYNADGSLDTTFNSTGIASIHVGGIYRVCSDMIIEPNGKIVLAGSIGDDFGSVRFNANGSPDTSFGNNGVFKKDFGASYDYGNVIVRQPDDKFILGGWTSFFCADRAFGLTRFSSPTLSTGEFENGNSIRIYPNPSHSVVNIKSDFDMTSIDLCDIQGRILVTSLQNSSEAALDISDKQNGVYFLKINTVSGSKVVKIVKE